MNPPDDRLLPRQWRQVDELLGEFHDLPEGEWEAHLDRRCPDDSAVRNEVESLLSHRKTINGFLESPALGDGFDLLNHDFAEDSARQFRPGDRLGKYLIRRLIAGGAVATVYEAEQEETQRIVALKVMCSGIVSPNTIRRFNDEVRILARLSHPGIAQMYDAGLHRIAERSTGLAHYFAMEFVPEGKPLTEFAGGKELSLVERIRLFIDICHAVNHGHQRTVIHRDLKPSNILVDRTGHPKVIDFGVARLMEIDVASVTHQTTVGGLVGTLHYMSPEQCDGDPHSNDVRTDVYSLGVVLYELLCGELPYRFEGSGIYQATRTIKNTVPTRPSSINRELRGDLDTIIMTALDKDPERRYQAASNLGEDLQRFLDNQPILARPPRVGYRIRKFIKRHRTISGLCALLILAVLAGGIGISLALLEAQSQRTTAVHAASRAHDVTRFLDEMLSSPYETFDGTKLPVSEMLKRASLQLESYFDGQLETTASLRRTLGKSYDALGLYKEARHEFEACLELIEKLPKPDDREVEIAEVLTDLAGVLHDCFELEEAEARLNRALSIQQRLLGEETPEFLRSRNYLGLIRIDQERYEEAREILADVLEKREMILGKTHSHTQQSLRNLSFVYSQLGDTDSAQRLIEEAVKRCDSLENLDLKIVINTKVRLASNLDEQGKPSEAIRLLKETLEHCDEVYSPDNPIVARTLIRLGRILNKTGGYDDAEQFLDRAVDIYRRKLGSTHEYTLAALQYLSTTWRLQGRPAESAALASEVVAGTKECHGERHAKVVPRTVVLVRALHASGNWEEAIEVIDDALGLLRFQRNPSSVGYPTLWDLHSMVLREAGETSEAISLVEKALAHYWAKCPSQKWILPMLETTHAEILIDLGHFDEAAALLKRSYPALEPVSLERQRRACNAIERLAEVYDERGLSAKGKECLEILKRVD